MCIYKTDDGKCEKFSDDKTTSYCINAPCEYEKLSNYDRIRNMSVNQMTALITKLAFFPCELCKREHTASCTHEDCFNIHKQWLESEAK